MDINQIVERGLCEELGSARLQLIRAQSVIKAQSEEIRRLSAENAEMKKKLSDKSEADAGQ